MSDELTDWRAWHEEYADPASGLSRRRSAVQERVADFLDRRPGPVRLVSACAGEGRDVIEVLARRPEDAAQVSGRLVELDPALAARARDLVEQHGLALDVVEGDAGATDSYAGAVPADLVLLCGVFGNITDEDIRATVEAVPTLMAPGAAVIWTRGRFEDSDLAPTIAAWFEDAGFVRTSFVAIDEPGSRLGHRVVAHELVGDPRPFEPGRQLFTFVR